MNRSKAEICKNFLKVAYSHFRKEVINISFAVSWFNIKSTEFGVTIRTIDKTRYMVVAICGSNDMADWILNFFLASWKGFKFSGWMEGKRIFKEIKKLRFSHTLPIIITTHSKSGPSGWALYELCKKAGMEIDSIHAFAPAKGLRKKMNIPCAVIYIDKNDIVPKASISLNHPDVGWTIYHPEKDGKGIDLSDHSLEHWNKVV